MARVQGSRNGARARELPYIAFACRFTEGLFCAVPKSYPIPDFLIGPGWRYWGSLDQSNSKAIGFKEKHAMASIQSEGYCFFNAPWRSKNVLCES